MKREDIEEIQEGKKDEVEKLPEKKQKLEDKKKEGEVQTPEIFADPTYDITFKMLFGSDKNKDVLISLLNSLLDFKGEKQIVDVTINSSDLSVEGISDIKGAVDVLCTTRSHQKIAVEMQRKYKDYFLSYEELWYNNLELVKKYIDTFNKLPSRPNKLINWIRMQTQNYKNKTKMMINKEIYAKWTEFINNKKYKEYFLSNEEIWFNNLKLVKNYINTNNNRPSIYDNNNNIKSLSAWIFHQTQNYKYVRKIMKKKEIYDSWTAFINDDLYKKYFD